MSKTFSKEEIIKKHKTNIKSAISCFACAGVLGIIYIIRFAFSGNFNFYFSLSFSELMLRLGDSGMLPHAAAYLLTAVYIIAFAAIAVFISKKADKLSYALIIYGFDSLCLIPLALLHGSSPAPEFFIDVIVHLFVLIFLIVGIKSEKAL